MNLIENILLIDAVFGDGLWEFWPFRGFEEKEKDVVSSLSHSASEAGRPRSFVIGPRFNCGSPLALPFRFRAFKRRQLLSTSQHPGT